MRISFLFIGLIFSLANAAYPQRMSTALSGSDIVRGYVTSDNPILGSLTVELEGFGILGSSSALVDGSGRFELRGLAPGQYQLRLTSAGGQVVHDEVVVIAGGDQNLSIHMAGTPPASQRNESTVSVHQLQHRVPAKAQKEYDKGQAAEAKGDQAAALSHFLKSTQIDPEFADAFNGAGAVLLSDGELAEAEQHFQKAIDLIPDHRAALANMSVVLAGLERHHEAAQVARRALKVDPGLMQVRYILGLSLIKDGADGGEALDNLQRAAADIPKAHLLAAKILADTGQREQAARHVEEYLQSRPGDGIDRQKVETWLEQLRH